VRVLCHTVGPGRREPRLEAATLRPPAVRQSTTTSSPGPAVLGLAVTALVGLALRPPRRQARHRPPVASPRLQALLALEVSPEDARPTEDRRRDPRPYPPPVESPERGKIVAVPYVGGLHQRYTRAAYSRTAKSDFVRLFSNYRCLALEPPSTVGPRNHQKMLRFMSKETLRACSGRPCCRNPSPMATTFPTQLLDRTNALVVNIF